MTDRIQDLWNKVEDLRRKREFLEKILCFTSGFLSNVVLLLILRWMYA